MVTNNELDKLEALARAANRCETLPEIHALQSLQRELYPATLLELIELARRSTSGSDLDGLPRGGTPHVCGLLGECFGACPACARVSKASGSDGTAAAELPPLPKNFGRFNINGPDEHRIRGWTSEQMQDYGRACYAIGRGAAVRDYISRPATSGSELASGSVLDIAARIFDFKPHKQTEEVKAKYLRFANEVIAQQDAPEAPTDERAQLLAELQAQEDDHAAIMRERVRAHSTATHQAGAAVDCGTNECRAGQRDGVICADGECDIASGQRAAPAPAAEEVRDAKDAADMAWSLVQQPKPAQVIGCGGSREFVGNMPCPGCDTCHAAAMSASQGKTEEAK